MGLRGALSKMVGVLRKEAKASERLAEGGMGGLRELALGAWFCSRNQAHAACLVLAPCVLYQTAKTRSWALLLNCPLPPTPAVLQAVLEEHRKPAFDDADINPCRRMHTNAVKLMEVRLAFSGSSQRGRGGSHAEHRGMLPLGPRAQ